MTTLSVDKVRDLKPGDMSNLPVIAADIIYGGAVVGVVKATGHARPLVGGDQFGGFAHCRYPGYRAQTCLATRDRLNAAGDQLGQLLNRAVVGVVKHQNVLHRRYAFKESGIISALASCVVSRLLLVLCLILF
jgi:hypothetical protein